MSRSSYKTARPVSPGRAFVSRLADIVGWLGLCALAVFIINGFLN